MTDLQRMAAFVELDVGFVQYFFNFQTGFFQEKKTRKRVTSWKSEG